MCIKMNEWHFEKLIENITLSIQNQNNDIAIAYWEGYIEALSTHEVIGKDLTNSLLNFVKNYLNEWNKFYSEQKKFDETKKEMMDHLYWEFKSSQC